MNATKTSVDGIKMDSKLEAYFYKSIKPHIQEGKATWKPPKVILQKGYTDWNGKKVRAIGWDPDCLFPGRAYVDPKGHATPSFKLRLKLYKFTHDLPVVLLKDKTQINTFVLLLRADNWEEIYRLFRA